MNYLNRLSALSQKGRRAFTKKLQSDKNIVEVFLNLLSEDITWYINDAISWVALKEVESDGTDNEESENDNKGGSY